MEVSNYKTKLALTSVGFTIIVATAVLFVFPLQQRAVDGNLSELLASRKVVMELRQEQKNTEIAADDLRNIEKQKVSPEEFFSKDTTLVREISYLEELSDKLGLDMDLSVSGTANSGVIVPEAKSLVAIPFSVKVNGEYRDLVHFLEYMENSAYLMSVRSVSLNVGANDTVTANLIGVFYLRK